MSKLIAMLQSLFSPHAADGVLLFWAKEILGALIIFAFFWIIAQLLTMFLEKWGGRFASFTKTDLDDRILKRVLPSVSLMLTFAGLYLAIRSLPLHEKIFVALSGGLYIANVVIICVVIYRVMDELLSWYVEMKQDQEGGGMISRQIIPMSEKIAMIFIIGGALIAVFKHFNYDIFSLVTALGIGSLAIGMAAKDTLAHVISGFTLMIDRPFRIGDRIKLANGQIGDVIDIGLRSTKIQALDSTVMIIPNSDLCNSALINMQRPTSVIQGRISVGVAYGSDVEHVKRVLLDIAGKNQEVLKDPAPLALFNNFGESALSMLFLFWINDPVRIGLVTDELNCAIVKRFREEGIEIPFPVRTVRIEREETA